MLLVVSSTSYGISSIYRDYFLLVLIILDHIREQASHIYSKFGLGIEYPIHSFREIQLVKMSILLILHLYIFIDGVRVIWHRIPTCVALPTTGILESPIVYTKLSSRFFFLSGYIGKITLFVGCSLYLSAQL